MEGTLQLALHGGSRDSGRGECVRPRRVRIGALGTSSPTLLKSDVRSCRRLDAGIQRVNVRTGARALQGEGPVGVRVTPPATPKQWRCRVASKRAAGTHPPEAG